MVRVVIATMVKDEDDVIEEWIRYYSSLFGYKNLFIIDNNSSDKTYEICEKYLKYGLHLERHDNYKMKGALMTMIKNNNPSDFFIPVDIDEFIVYKNKTDNTVSCDVTAYLESLIRTNPHDLIFKMNYIMPFKTNDELPLLKQFTHGEISDYGVMAKTFIQNNTYSRSQIQFDHGNHFCTHNYVLSDLYLIHYHKRSDVQHKKKIVNNVLGLGYQMNIDYLKSLHNSCPGIHHVKNAIQMLEHPELDNSPKLVTVETVKDKIQLHHFIDFIYNNNNDK
jgi:hypothetical protein